MCKNSTREETKKEYIPHYGENIAHQNKFKEHPTSIKAPISRTKT